MGLVTRQGSDASRCGRFLHESSQRANWVGSMTHACDLTERCPQLSLNSSGFHKYMIR